jgi:uncharacterized protein YndB with AHSA1/START domain
MKPNPIVKEVTVNAAPARVWKAITDNDEMKKWYFDIKKFEPVVGFEFSFTGQGKEGEIYLHLCRITEVVPGKKLSYTWKYEGYPGESRVTFELFPEDNKTRIKLTHEGLDTFPDDPAFAKENFEAGWNAIIGTNLKEFVEKQE